MTARPSGWLLDTALLPPEVRLVLAGAALPAPAGSPARAAQQARVEALLDEPLAWDAVHAMARRERAESAVWAHLAPLVARGAPVPAEVAEALGRVARVGQFRALVLEQRLHETVAALAALDVPCVLLKGAALATAAYPTFADRPMVDLDLLVPSTDASRAWTAMLDAGWSENPAWDGADEYHHLPTLLDARSAQTSLELHTEVLGLGHPFGLSADAVRARAVPWRVGRTAAAVPAPAHLFVHAAVHFMWQHMGRLHGWKAARDAAAIAAMPGFDWGAVVAFAHEARAASCCYWMLRLAEAVGTCAPPADALAALRPRGPAALDALVLRGLALNLFPSGADCPSARGRRALWSAAVRPTASGHGAARPWVELALTAEQIARRAPDRGGAAPRPLAGRLLDAGRGWARYAWRLGAGGRRVGRRMPHERHHTPVAAPPHAPAARAGETVGPAR